MNRDNTKPTLIALIALVLVCGGSFLGVRMLNKNANVSVPTVVITTTQSQSTTAESTTTTEAVITPATTLPVATTAALDATTKLNQFTTFANPSAVSTTAPTETAKEESTTKKAETTTTTNNITVTPVTTSPSTTSQEIIESAAVFSEGFLSYVFDPDGEFYYTVSDPWQRQFGFNELYDIAAPFAVFYYDTMRCKFNYDNKDWMIQFWKGQYGFVFIGAEIGVYNKPMDRSVNHYDCASDEDSLMMSMTFYRNGEELLTRDYSKYWWCTGFVPGSLKSYSDRSELSVRCRITLKDQAMLLAFCDSLSANGLEYNKDYTTQGLDTFIYWQ